MSISTDIDSSSARHRVALVEDHQDIREQWCEIVESSEQFTCVCTCSSAEEALRKLPAARPEVILMDIFLPKMSGIECTARIKELLPETRILVVTASDDEELVFHALEAGADGYLLKHSSPAEVVQALDDILRGGMPMTSGIARKVAEFFHKKGEERRQLVRLSHRETEVLELIAAGYVNKEIADKLSLTVQTVRSYLKTIYEKLHVHSRAEAVLKYMKQPGK
ncbi:MAG: response regulator transcription factor [Luteolibacter sp.]